MNDRLAFTAIAVLTVAVVGVVGALMVGGGGRATGLDVSALPLLNACLNAVSAGFLTAGYVFIRLGRVTAHITCMLSAFTMSALFLASYVTYHYHAGSRPYTGEGWIRLAYFAILISHIVLAAAIVPLALTTIYRGLRGFFRYAPFDPHVRVAQRALPIWLYVSISGVVVYWMLYQ